MPDATRPQRRRRWGRIVWVSALNPRKGKKLFIGLNGVGHELAVPEQRVGSHRGEEILRGFFVRDVDGFLECIAYGFSFSQICP